MRQLTISLAALFMFLLAAPFAKADVVQEWNYTSDAIFISWTDEYNRTGSYGNNSNTDIQGVGAARSLGYAFLNGAYAPGSIYGYNSLRWGGNGSYSSVGLQQNSGSLFTDGDNTGLGVTLSHNNQAISTSYATLQQGSVLLTLDLDAVGSSMEPLPIFAVTMDFYFIETPNASSGSTARDPDIFIVKEPFQAASQRFEFDGVDYWFTFEASFEPLTGWFLEEAQRLLGTTETLYGWTTLENRTTTFETQFSILHERRPVTATPEPGTMLLMGIGLAGLGFMARRRR